MWVFISRRNISLSSSSIDDNNHLDDLYNGNGNDDGDHDNDNHNLDSHDKIMIADMVRKCWHLSLFIIIIMQLLFYVSVFF